MRYIVDTYLTRAATFLVEEQDGIWAISIGDPGTVFQRVTDRLLREMDNYERRVFDFHLRSLHRDEPLTRTHWYIRRGYRFLYYWCWWQVSSAVERLEIGTLRTLFKAVSLFRTSEDQTVLRLGWRSLVRYAFKNTMPGDEP